MELFLETFMPVIADVAMALVGGLAIWFTTYMKKMADADKENKWKQLGSQAAADLGNIAKNKTALFADDWRKMWADGIATKEEKEALKRKILHEVNDAASPFLKAYAERTVHNAEQYVLDMIDRYLGQVEPSPAPQPIASPPEGH